MSLTVTPYSERALVVRGDTASLEKYNDALTQIGGWFHKGLKRGGPGWIFSKRRHGEAVNAFFANLQRELSGGQQAIIRQLGPYRLIDYSARGMVMTVEGLTRADPDFADVNEEMTKLGGFWNKGLTIGGQKQGGFTFSKERHTAAVNQWLDEIDRAAAEAEQTEAPLRDWCE